MGTHRGKPCEDTGRPRRGAWASLSLEASGEANLASTLILDLRPPKRPDNTFLVFSAPQPVVFCYSSLSRRTPDPL